MSINALCYVCTDGCMCNTRSDYQSQNQQQKGYEELVGLQDFYESSFYFTFFISYHLLSLSCMK